MLFFVFFFQAEDGIRDESVTGVQTCALPIFDLVIMRLEGGYDLGIMHGVQDALEESGHRLTVFTTHENEDVERLWLRRLLDRSTDGVLLLLPYERVGITDSLVDHHIPF